MRDDPWDYDKLSSHHPELKYLPPFLYGNYYSLIHWGDGTLNGHWVNTIPDNEYIEFCNYMFDQFPDIIEQRTDYPEYATEESIIEALLITNEAQQVFLKMNWGRE